MFAMISIEIYAALLILFWFTVQLLMRRKNFRSEAVFSNLGGSAWFFNPITNVKVQFLIITFQMSGYAGARSGTFKWLAAVAGLLGWIIVGLFVTALLRVQFNLGNAKQSESQLIEDIEVAVFSIESRESENSDSSYQLFVMAHEVTHSHYKQCAEAGECSHIRPRKDRLEEPIHQLTWDMVEVFIDWLRNETRLPWRLPTSAEWSEIASKSQIAVGSEGLCGRVHISTLLGTNDECGGSSRPVLVASFSPDVADVFDLLGNVRELTSSCVSYRRNASCDVLTTRGGSFATAKSELYGFGEAQRDNLPYDVGFRLVYDTAE
ncbi:MAG: SUMF1/EgtB/PvdO family nonheme iron enzyme [Pseudomonadales bacterium]